MIRMERGRQLNKVLQPDIMQRSFSKRHYARWGMLQILLSWVTLIKYQLLSRSNIDCLCATYMRVKIMIRPDWDIPVRRLEISRDHFSSDPSTVAQARRRRIIGTHLHVDNLAERVYTLQVLTPSLRWEADTIFERDPKLLLTLVLIVGYVPRQVSMSKVATCSLADW